MTDEPTYAYRVVNRETGNVAEYVHFEDPVQVAREWTEDHPQWGPYKTQRRLIAEWEDVG